ncbi:hypothetical protein OTU49_002690 [Cherax quadricarinatus]|uniref:Uncharacterized protein n=1 Tax=Cherax quadricarinatus TaxID=27406 RepID=A0AAW0X8F3_CHEQU|nr:integrator complex subunit 15-like isoform X1 [Cherax quadricarinatus]XP_053634886.1 integrator complex subunit 15-like isoform X1 [Cherax quadricarinatus]
MSVDLSELKLSDFPPCVRLGLRKLEEVLAMPPAPHLHDVQQHIMDRYIFCCRDSRSSKIRAVGPVEELVVVRELGQHLGKIVDTAARNSLFITLFHPSSHDPRTPHKLRILSALVSLAIATHNVSVLEATAVWMQQVCCLSSWSGEVCRGLVQDYFQFTSSSPPHFAAALRALPTMAPLFTANLITTLSQLYAKVGSGEICERPPETLVSTVVWWLKGVPGLPPHLALAPLTHSLPGVSLPMTAVPPIAPLMKWCVEAPFFENTNNCSESQGRRSSLPKLMEAEGFFDKATSAKLGPSESTNLYSQLHLSILHTLQNVPSVRARMTQKQVLCPKHVTSVVDAVCERIRSCGPENEEVINMSLDRLAQIILVALHTESLAGSLSDMWDSLHRLPIKNRLITTLLATREAR